MKALSRSMKVLSLVSALLAAQQSTAFITPSSLTHNTLATTRLHAATTTPKDTYKDDDLPLLPTPTSRRSALSSLWTGAAVVVATCSLSVASPAWADGQTKEFKFPPIDYTDTNRCRVSSSTIGQANAARDKLYDLRECNLKGVQAVGYDLSGVIMTKTDLSNADLKEAYFSKGFLRNSKFDGADFSNAIVDRASFQGSSLKGALFKNSVLTGTSFEGADVEGADFSEAALGLFDARNLCRNPTLKGVNPQTGEDTRLSAGCT